MSLNKQIKVLAFDYDGTLVDRQRNMTEKTMYALKELKKNGYKLAMASGRACLMCKRVISDNLDPSYFDYFFGGNGAEYIDSKDNKVNRMFWVKRVDLLHILKTLENTVGFTLTYNDKVISILNSVSKEKEEIAKNLMPLTIERINPEDIDYEPPKILYIFNPDDYEEAVQTIENAHFEGFHIARSGPNLIEIMPNTVSKKNVVTKIMELEGIKEDEIMAFGDESNDLPMLDACVGVVMGNARQEIKDMYKYHAYDVTEDGIYGFLKENGFIS